MGRFKDGEKVNEIIQWLTTQGYKKGSGAQGEKGYVKVYSNPEEDYLNYTWVTISIYEKKIYIYVETHDESFVTNSTIDIEDDCLKDLDTFIDEVDKKLDSWI